jgi:hypothetical protein
MDSNTETEKLAYFLWKNAGEPSGTAERDWLFAQHVVETGSVTPPDWSNHPGEERVETPSTFPHTGRDSS